MAAVPITEIPAGDELLDAKETTEALGFKDRSSITYYVRQGRLIPFAESAGGRLFLRSEIDRFKREVLGKSDAGDVS